MVIKFILTGNGTQEKPVPLQKNKAMSTLIIHGNSSKAFEALMAIAKVFGLKASFVKDEELLYPNAETIEAIEAADAGEGYIAKDVSDFMDKLDE